MARWANESEMLALMKEKLYTPVVGDILDKEGYNHQFLPASIRPLRFHAPGAAPDNTANVQNLKVAGFACTILEREVFSEPDKPFGYMTEALDQLRPNEVYVATGAKNSALWGELLTATARTRGAVGAVVDGYSRDTLQVLEQNFPVFCSGCWAQDSSIRSCVCEWRCTIEIGQVTIHDGDIIFGDVDGVLVIPREAADVVLEKALLKAEGEKNMRKDIENGMTATEAFAKYGIL